MQHQGAIIVMKAIEQEIATAQSKNRKIKYAKYGIKRR